MKSRLPQASTRYRHVERSKSARESLTCWSSSLGLWITKRKLVIRMRQFLLVVTPAIVLSACEPAPEKPRSIADDHAALGACGSQRCAFGSATRHEDGSPDALWNMSCILEAMRDRTSHKYFVVLNQETSYGTQDTLFTVFITPSGAAEVAAADYTKNEEPDTLHPIQRCTLKPASYFDACLNAVNGIDPFNAPDAAWNCVFPGDTTPIERQLPWFDKCEDATTTCE